jgi:hypothetical protein
MAAYECANVGVTGGCRTVVSEVCQVSRMTPIYHVTAEGDSLVLTIYNAAVILC